MSDVMLHGVLRMPPRLWSGDVLDVTQRHGRYLQASERIEADTATIAVMREALEAIEHALRMGFSPAEVLDENSPIRDGIRSALLRPNAELSRVAASEMKHDD